MLLKTRKRNLIPENRVKNNNNNFLFMYFNKNFITIQQSFIIVKKKKLRQIYRNQKTSFSFFYI